MKEKTDKNLAKKDTDLDFHFCSSMIEFYLMWKNISISIVHFLFQIFFAIELLKLFLRFRNASSQKRTYIVGTGRGRLTWFYGI
jgi:hypothetical protein